MITEFVKRLMTVPKKSFLKLHKKIIFYDLKYDELPTKLSALYSLCVYWR